MATKTISIMDDVHQLLVSNRRKSESFSEILRRVLSKNDIMQFAGTLKNISTNEVKTSIQEIRDNSTKDILK